MSHRSQRTQETLPKLRQACDMCHHAKVKCSDDEPCARCRDNNLHCSHSYAIKAGKPKGSKNRKTLERLEQIRMEAEKAQNTAPTTPSSSQSLNRSRKRSRASQDEYREEGQLSHMHGYDAGLTPPLTFHDIESTGDNADHMFPLNMEDFVDLPMDVNFNISPPSTNADDRFDMESFSLTDTMRMNSPFDSLINSNSTTQADRTAYIGSNTPILHDSRNSSRSSSLIRPLQANLFDATSSRGSKLLEQSTNTSTSCFCFSQQAFQLNQLYSLSMQAEHQRLDLLLQCINDTLSAVDSFLRCSLCSKDSPPLLVTVATTQLVFCQIQKLLSHSGSVRLSIGEYRPSQDDELAMKKLLIERAVQKGRNTMRELRRVVSIIGSATQNHPTQENGSGSVTSQAQTANLHKTDIKYLSSVIDGLESVLAALTADLLGDRFKHL